MTSTQNPTVTVAKGDIDRAAGVERYLGPVVRDLVALAVNGKQAHWHVRGANFIGVHEFLDTLVAHAGAGADEAAERIVALGLPIDARVETVAQKAAGTTVSAGYSQSTDTIRSVVADIDKIIADLDAAIEGLDEIDLTSQDIVIGIKASLEKDRWFLVAHIAE